MQEWHIRIDDEAEVRFSTASTIYRYAAAAVPATFGRDLPCKIEIWAIHNGGKELGRYTFRAREDDYGRFVLDHLVLSSASHEECRPQVTKVEGLIRGSES